jgi:uncharacterized delta-60 repeat protein
MAGTGERMTGGRRRGSRIGLATLLVVLLVSGVAVAASRRPGSPDPSFGKGGRVVVSLPPASSPSWFGPIAPTAEGGFLVVYNVSADIESYTAVIERRQADGALDPSFGRGGVVTVRGSVTALAEDPTGGVIYAGYGTIGRLRPDGAKDKAFDSHHPARGSFGPVKIAFDSAGRILLGGSVAMGARYHAHEGQSAIMRLDPDGRRDASFGSGGVVWLSEELIGPGLGGDFGLLPDGSILVLGAAVEHLAADGTVLPTPRIAGEEESPHSVVVFPDGSFATAGSPLTESGCTVVRYRPDGSLDPAFAQAGTFFAADLSECGVAAAPEGGLLVRGVVKRNEDEGTPKLLFLSAAGAPVVGFGNGGSLSVAPPAGSEPGEAWNVEGTVFSPGGGLVIAGGGGSYYAGGGVATLIGLAADGRPDPAFGSGGTVSQPASPPSWTSPRAMLALPDGELIVSAMTDSGRASRHPAWMRFERDGKLIRARSGAAFVSVLPYPASRLLAAHGGEVYALMNHLGSTIAKLKVDGTPVGGFGKDGLVRLPHGFWAASIVVDPDGGVTAVGRDQASGRVAAYRLTANGHPDRRFGRHGLALVRVRGASQGTAKAAVMLPGGDVVVLGSVEGKRFAAVRLGPGGRLRRGFGGDGLLACRCGGVNPARISAVLHRGRFYVLDHGVTKEGELTDLLKLTLAGRLDRSFAGRGWRKAQIGGSSVALFARGGRLLAVGQHGYFEGPATVHAFRLDGAQVRSYKASATVRAGGRRGSARLSATMQPGGRLVLAGEQRLDRESEGTRLELLGLR